MQQSSQVLFFAGSWFILIHKLSYMFSHNTFSKDQNTDVCGVHTSYWNMFCLQPLNFSCPTSLSYNYGATASKKKWVKRFFMGPWRSVKQVQKPHLSKFWTKHIWGWGGGVIYFWQKAAVTDIFFTNNIYQIWEPEKKNPILKNECAQANNDFKNFFVCVSKAEILWGFNGKTRKYNEFQLVGMCWWWDVLTLHYAYSWILLLLLFCFKLLYNLLRVRHRTGALCLQYFKCHSWEKNETTLGVKRK